MNNQIKRLLNLVRQTGDAIIVMSEDMDSEPCVVLPLDRYEGFVGTKQHIDCAGGMQTVEQKKEVVAQQDGHVSRQEVKTSSTPEHLATTDDVLNQQSDTETQFYLEPVE